MPIPDKPVSHGLRTADTTCRSLAGEAATSIHARALTWSLALLLICGATGCHWIGGAPGKSSLSKLLSDEKNDDEAIRKAALKDSSFPSANQPAPAGPKN